MLRLVLALTFLALLVLSLVVLRLRVILNRSRPKPRHNSRHPDEPTHLLVVLGSGGHTAEMIAMLERAMSSSSFTTTSPSSSRSVSHASSGPRLGKSFTFRTWVVSAGDALSASRAETFEREYAADPRRSDDADAPPSPAYRIAVVPRARRIHQSLASTPWSSLACMRACRSILVGNRSSPTDTTGSSMKTTTTTTTTTTPTTAKRAKVGSDMGRPCDFPDVILCNGPATATILIFTSIVLRFFDVGWCHSRNKMRTVYVESWARVQKLSLSGRLLKHVVDRFLVQWPQLAQKEGDRVEYIGVLV